MVGLCFYFLGVLSKSKFGLIDTFDAFQQSCDGPTVVSSFDYGGFHAGFDAGFQNAVQRGLPCVSIISSFFWVHFVFYIEVLDRRGGD